MARLIRLRVGVRRFFRGIKFALIRFWRRVFASYIPEWLGGLGTTALVVTAFGINPYLGGYTLGVSGLVWGLVVAESNRPG